MIDSSLLNSYSFSNSQLPHRETKQTKNTDTLRLGLYSYTLNT